MTNRRCKKVLSHAKVVTFIIAGLSFTLTGYVNAEPNFFGYFANNNEIHETSDHTNVTVIWAGTWPDLDQSTALILQGLADAQAAGIKAIIPLDAFLFRWRQTDQSGLKHCPFSSEPNASSQFNELVLILISEGYLVPGNPDASVVKAFFIVDEPDRCGLTDLPGLSVPHPVLQGAVDVVKSHPSTANFPTMIIASDRWANSLAGLRLVDWVGMFHYNKSTQQYLINFSNFQSHLLPSQRAILVPQASQGGMMSNWGHYHDPDLIMAFYRANVRTIGLIPFLWEHHDTSGVRDIALLRSAYTNYGAQIKNDSIIYPAIGCWLDDLSWDTFICTASASGGSGGFSFEWSNGETGVQDSTWWTLQCPHPQSGLGHTVYEDVEVKIVDSSGSYAKARETIFCP